MRGSRVNRGKNRWALVLDLGYVVAPDGTRKRKQKWISFSGTKKEAGDKLTDLVRAANRDEFIEPTKLTVGEWLAEWLVKVVEPARRHNTYLTYQHVVSVVKPALGHLRLQALKPADLQAFYSAQKHLAAASIRLYHSTVSAALESAMKQGLLTRNVALRVEGLPRVERTADDVAANCWDVDEARKFLDAAQAAGPRPAAFYALALDSGARRGELCGLKWADVDLDAGRLAIARQLISSTLAADGTVVFGPPKTGRSRSVDLSANTIALLRAHKKHQAEVMMRNRRTYRDLDLVFSKEAPDLFRKTDTLGTPIQSHGLGVGEFGRLIAAAGVKRITFHGLRHTSATLLLMAGEPAKVVSERLGHAKVGITLDTYTHVLPSMGRAAADRLGALLHDGRLTGS